MTVKRDYDQVEEITIGTRGSALALWQAHKVRDELVKIRRGLVVNIKIIKTSGDWRPEDGEVRLEALEGGKAQFAKEIEEAMLAGQIDIAVHSMKDMETELPDSLVIPYMLPREDVRDAFLSDIAQNIDDLPEGSVVGTASVRRQAFVLKRRPDLKIVPFRGNVQTRIGKLRDGQVDATFLACAGLNRLELSHEISAVVPTDVMLPSVGQGAIGIEMRESDLVRLSYISQISCEETVLKVTAERAALNALGGSCHTPVGVLSTLDNGKMSLVVEVVSPDGENSWREEQSDEVTSVDDAQRLGRAVGKALVGHVPKDIL